MYAAGYSERPSAVGSREDAESQCGPVFLVDARRQFMHSLFVWLETSSFSVWVRESTSVFAFPTILSLHTIGMGLVAGINAAIDLRILGVAPQVPLLELKRFFPIIWIGFWLNAASGVVLLIGYPTKALTNPVFYTKLGFIALGLIALRAIRHRVFRHASLDSGPVPPRGKLLAAASLVCWAGAIATGRFLAYTYVHLMSAHSGVYVS